MTLAIVAGIANLVFVGVGTLVGVRLLVLASRTRELPETMLGFSLLLVSTLGVGMLALAAMVGTPEDPSRPLAAIGTGALAWGWILTAEFTRRVFRPHSPVACVASALSVAALAIASASYILSVLGGIGAVGITERWEWVVIRLCALGFYGWCGIESFRYWRMLEKRLALGLADPIVTNRLFLWTAVMACSVLNLAVSWAATVAGASPVLEAGVNLLTLVAGTTCALGLYLAFLPPAAFVRRFQRAA